LPFEKLKVRHDDDEEGHTTTTAPQGTQLFQQPQQEVKKKKIRPEERKRLEEEAKSGQGHQEDNQGFSEVKKRKPNPKAGNIDSLIENEFESGTGRPQQKNKKELDFQKSYQPRAPRGGKRVYDRQSGTGRGKEISKDGAGGKTTWGNPEQLAKQEVYEEADYGYEDDLFNYAQTIDVTKKDETKETKATEEIKHEEKPYKEEEKKEKKEGQREKRRKKRLGAAAEEEKKDAKTDVPDNSISYKDYKDKIKTEPKKEEKKEAQSFVQKTDLKEKKKDAENLEISIASNKPEKKPEPVKEKKVDKTEQDLNRLLGQKLVEGTSTREERPQGRGYQGKQPRYEKKENQGGFAFNKDAFPELK